MTPTIDQAAMDQASVDQATIDRVIQMAWEDRTTFDAIQRQFGLNESAVIQLMRKSMKASSFKMWRSRVTGRKTKHQALRSTDVMRFKSRDQKNRDF
jgi:uncharacterized protein (TIGR03643 family)